MKTDKQFRPLTDIPGVGAVTEHLLTEAGYGSIEAVAVSSSDELVKATGIRESTALKIIKSARQISGIRESNSKAGEPVRKRVIGNQEFNVMGTIEVDLLDLPPDRLASAYIQGHLILQTHCTKKGAQEFMEWLRELDKLIGQIENQQELLNENYVMLKELKRRMDELNTDEPDTKDHVMYG